MCWRVLRGSGGALRVKSGSKQPQTRVELHSMKHTYDTHYISYITLRAIYGIPCYVSLHVCSMPQNSDNNDEY